jgi:hypothetical protein
MILTWTPTEGSHNYANKGAATVTPHSPLVTVGATPHKVAGTPGTGKNRPGAGEA